MPSGLLSDTSPFLNGALRSNSRIHLRFNSKECNIGSLSLPSRASLLLFTIIRLPKRYIIAFWCIISTFLVFSDAQQRERAAWISGNFTSLGTDVYSNYVDKGVPSSRAYPGGRYNFQSAYDQTRREVWIYGGTGYGSPAQVPAIMLNDLWVFRLHDSRWIWFSGNGSASYRSSTYGPLGTPGTSYSPESRISPAGWINPITREYFLYGGSDGGGGRSSSFSTSDATLFSDLFSPRNIE